MVSKARIAGIIGLASIVVPLQLTFGSNFSEIDWMLFGAEFLQRGIYSFNISQFILLDRVLSTLLFLFVIAGSLLLIVRQRPTKAGALLLGLGILTYLVDALYLESRASFSYTTVPLGFFLIVPACVLAFTAKPSVARVATIFTADTSVDKLIKLKALLDSGAITREEFEEQKRLILAAGH